MSYCPKCDTKIRAEMSFCPKCGEPLKVVQPTAEAMPPTPYRAEKAEKREKGEKEERYEKREYEYVGPLTGGLFLMLVGLIFYFMVTASLRWETAGALFFIVLGIIIMVGAIYGVTVAARRHPKP